MARRFRPALLAALTAVAAVAPLVAAADAGLSLPPDAVEPNTGDERCAGDANGDAPGTGHVELYLSEGGDPETNLDTNLDGAVPILNGAVPILRFGDLSDTHIIDDDGPDLANGTVTEVVLDPAIGNTSATFLNEEFTDEVLDGMFHTLNACHETVPLALTITTGDITDTNWLNVVRRVIDNVDGVANQPTAFEAACGYLVHDDTEDPRGLDGSDCPIPAELMAIPTGRLIADAQQPSGGGTVGPDVEGDATYQLNTTRALRQALESAATAAANGSSNIAAGLPPALQDSGNEGLGMPFYAAFGNHDAIVKGTVTYQAPMGPALATFGRYFLQSKREFINEWLFSGGEEGFGFGNVEGGRLGDNDDQNDGWYSFLVPLAVGADGAVGAASTASLASMARFIVLDTTWSGVDGDMAAAVAPVPGVDGGEVTNPTGLEAGYVSQDQFDWLTAELTAAEAAGEPVFVFSHHPDRTFIEEQYSADLSRIEVRAEQIDRLLGRDGSTVVAWIAGHTHANRVNPCRTDSCLLNGRDLATDGSIEHGFWRFETASLIDWPQEGRIVELFDLDDLDADGLDDETGAPSPMDRLALRLTMISPDQGSHDAVVGRARTLSGYEAMCTVSAMAGGPLPSANPATPETLAANLLAGDFCPATGAVTVGSGTPAGSLADRDVVLAP
ncbi:MAG TPA: hypothetical protein VGA13_07855 [Acidimicrobiales bacterium]